MSKAEFEKIVFEAIDECLNSLGEPSRFAIYVYLQKTFIRKEDILENAEVFSQTLEEIFGLGGNYLETLILRSLCQKTGWIGKDSFKHVDLSQALAAVKKELEF